MIECNRMKSYRWLLGPWMFFSAVTFFSILLFFGLFSPPVAKGQGGGSRSLSGYAWSSNLGWINFKGTWTNPSTGVSGDYGVELTSDNKFINYAWGSNVGWINFNPSTTFASGDGWPSGAINLYGVELDSNGTDLTGWARACSVFKNDSTANTCKGELRSSTERGGWDGWISVNCSNTNSCATSGYKVTYTAGQLDNFAWGSDVVGWIDFCNSASDSGADHCVTVDSLNVQCSAPSPVNVNDNVVWTADVISGGTDPYDYTYCWGTSCDPDLSGAVIGITKTITDNYLAAGSVAAEVMVKDNTTGKTGRGVCSIQVQDILNPSLTVYPVGGDEKGKVDANIAPAPVSGSISNCRTSTGSCVANYAVDSNVTLTTTPSSNPNSPDPVGDPNYHYTWSEPSCAGDKNNTSSCPVIVGAGGKSVTVTFRDQANNDPTFTVNPNLISIEFHNSGQSAQSSESTLTLTSGQDTELCVDSFTSFTGNSIKSIINAIPGNHPPVQCYLGGQPGSCSNTPPNCVTLSPGGSTTFSVSIPEKLIEILNNSPYFIKLRAGNTVVPIRFEYRVRDIRP